MDGDGGSGSGETTMEDAEVFLYFVLGLWLLLKKRLRARHARRRRQARLLAQKRNLLLQEALRQHEETLERLKSRRRMMMALLEQCSLQKRALWMLDRASQWWDTIVPGFTETMWLENFRMSEATFTYLCNKLRPAMQRRNTSFRNCVPLRKRVAIALWKLATGSEYRSISQLFGVSTTTVWRCVKDLCAAAETLLMPEQIHLPDETKFREMAFYFESKWGLPQCVGAIDCVHVPIIAPKHFQKDSCNPRGWHSMIVQAVVDGEGMFWNVFASLSGSMDNASVLRLSTLWELASHGNLFPANSVTIEDVNIGYYILGNSSYPLQDWLVKPFSDTGGLTEQQVNFNQKLNQARVVVENAFSRLKGRWRCMLKRNDCDGNLVRSLALTCCALHNLCESRGETFENAWADPEVSPWPDAAPTIYKGVEVEGVKRNALMLHLSDQ